MKLKKIASIIVALAFAAGMAVIPTSAATLTAVPGDGTMTYKLDVTLKQPLNLTYKNGDSITVDSSMIDGTKTNVNISANGKTYKVVKVENAKLAISSSNYAMLNNNSTTVNVDFWSSTFSILYAGASSEVTWTATLTLEDTSHPINDLGLDLNNLTYSPMSLNFKVADIAIQDTKRPDGVLNLPVGSFDGKVTGKAVTSTELQTFASNETITIGLSTSSNIRVTTAERAAFKNATNISITATLSEKATTSKKFTFNTDNTTSSNAPTATVSSGSDTITFSTVSPQVLYDNTYDWPLTWFKITEDGNTSNYKYTKIVITYTPGTGTTTTNNNTTTTDEKDAESEGIMSLNFTKVTINAGSSVYLEAFGDNVTYKYNSNGGVITAYKSGRVLANKAGTATVTATGSNTGEKIVCSVTVKSSSNPATNFKLGVSSGTVYKGLSYNLASGMTITSNTTDTINWSTSDPNIATVTTAGKVTVKGTGKVTITAVTSSGIESSATLTAKNPSITLTESSATINAGSTYKISATALPKSSTLTYSSSSSSIATVSSSGTITGISAGTATITVKSNRGVIKTFTVTVK